MKKKLLIWIIMVMFIWGNSCLPAEQSNDVSGSITYQLYEWLHLAIDFDLFHHLVRKMAHFSEYALLGILTIAWMKDLKFHPTMSGILCFIVACLDETIQYFVPGRSNQLSDVMIDTSGAFVGVLFFIVIMKLLRKRGCNKIEDFKYNKSIY